ncbi:MAG: hypothetical protein QNJ92_05515 [Alphaproteobacteria bacterium]|nr:hypothetical protein [Alphaproteobacteria bacterium]
MKTATSLGLLCLSALVAAGSAVAQDNPWDAEDTVRFRTSDRGSLMVAVQKLHDANAQIGETGDWENSNSGNGGTVTLIERFDRNGQPCMRLGCKFVVKGQADPKHFTFRGCLDDDGKWKILD